MRKEGPYLILPHFLKVNDARRKQDFALPEGVRVGDERLVLITEPAARQVAKLIDREDAESTFASESRAEDATASSYKMKFVGGGKKGDILVRSSGAQALIDSKTALYLRGTTWTTPTSL